MTYYPQSRHTKQRIDNTPTMRSEEFDVGTYATRLVSYTRKVTSTGSGFTKKSKYNGDIQDAMRTARTLMETVYAANEMPRREPYLTQRLLLIRKAIGLCSYFENAVYSFWESDYISGAVWEEWTKRIGILKGRCITWFNSLENKA